MNARRPRFGTLATLVVASVSVLGFGMWLLEGGPRPAAATATAAWTTPPPAGEAPAAVAVEPPRAAAAPEAAIATPAPVVAARLAEPAPPRPPAAPRRGSRQGGGEVDHAERFATLLRKDPQAALAELVALSAEARGDPTQEHQVVEVLALLDGKLREGDDENVIELYEHAGDDVQCAAARLLAAKGDERLRDRFLDARAERLAARDPTPRADAAALLGRLGGDRAIERLTRLLGDSSDEVLIAALNALLVSAGDSAARHVRPLVDHPTYAVSALAAAALARWEEEAVCAAR